MENAERDLEQETGVSANAEFELVEESAELSLPPRIRLIYSSSNR